MTFQCDKSYSRREIHEVLGGSVQWYLPARNGKVVCGAFRPDANPDAPLVILPGLGPTIQKTAEWFEAQGTAIPVFLKRAANRWEYVGDFRVQRLSRDPAEIAQHAARAGREKEVSMILFLEKVPQESVG
jgi:hypothetical protein